MTSTIDPPAEVDQAVDGEPHGAHLTTGQSGGISFPDLVRAHFQWQQGGEADAGLEQRYKSALEKFQASEGEVRYAYWATRRPSAVALTIKPRGRIASFLTDNDAIIRLHRVTDWVARERSIADLMHHCDTLAIKVSEVLRGTTERIAMQWIYAVQSHLLGFVERTQGRATSKEIADLVSAQEQELIQIEKYYSRAGEKAARIVYFWGMIVGAVIDGLMAAVLAAALWATGWLDRTHANSMETFFICYVAGGLGAIVSVLMRMSSNSFRVDYEVGRATIRRLGSFRPFIGAIFGIAVYFLIKSGIPNVQLPADQNQAFFFLAAVAFLSGFNERWTNVLFGKAESTIAASLGSQPAKTTQEDDEEE
jgi:hypothetical protein